MRKTRTSATEETCRLAEPDGERKVHSLIDKVYKRKNLEMAWERVKANRGAGGVDGQSIDDFAEVREEQLGGLHEELRQDVYRPQPVRQKRIPKAGKPGAHRELGIPTVYDRVCQQALLNRLEPIFEPVFDDASFGYRRGRSQHDALRKVWKELESGCEWVVDGDLSDFFGMVDHDKLLTLVAQRVSDGQVKLPRVHAQVEAFAQVPEPRAPVAAPRSAETPEGSRRDVREDEHADSCTARPGETPAGGVRCGLRHLGTTALSPMASMNTRAWS